MMLCEYIQESRYMLRRFSVIYFKGDNFQNFMFSLLNIIHFLNKAYSTRKEFAESGANSFLAEWAFVQKGGKTIMTESSPIKSVSVTLVLLEIAWYMYATISILIV